MKKILKAFSLFALLLSSGLNSCSNDDNEGSQGQETILDVAASKSNLSILVQALNRTNLSTTTLYGGGPYTVFAPTNEAFNIFFTSLGNNIDVNTVDINILKNILLNHVVPAEISSSAIPANTYYTTLSPVNSTNNSPGISMFVQKSASIVTINGGIDSKGAIVTTADLEASNGVIHIVNRVIQIPNIVDHVIDNPAFNTLQTMVTSMEGTNGNQSEILTTLSNFTPLAPGTLFAPNVQAFTDATTGSGFAVGATGDVIGKVLQYHITSAGNLRSGLLQNNQTVTTITDPPQSVTVLLAGSNIDLRDSANNPSRILQPDIQAANGVIHGVNRVLKPQL